MAKGAKKAAGLVGAKAPQKQGYSTFDGGVQQENAASAPPKATYGSASWFSRLIFGYADPVLAIGNARQLEMEDLWELEGDNRTSAAYAKFKASYLHHDQSVVRAIASTFGGKFFLSGVGSAMMAACAVFAPAVLHHVIDAFSQPVIDLEDLTMWVAAFFASRLVNAFTEAHVNFNLEMALLQLTVSMKALIFEKAMRRSIQSKNDNEMVDVSNLFTADIDNLMWAGYQINVVWVMPMQCAVVIYMLYDVLDVAAFAGLGIIFLSMFFNYIVAKGYMAAYNDIMKFKDVRMKVVKEVFGAIQIIKLNAWESKFLDRIRQWRGKEIAAISRYLYLMAVSIFLFWGAPLCVSVTSFATYSLVLGKELTAAKVFTAMVLFTSIRDPLSQFPDALQALLQAGLAVERMATYLGAEEVHPDRISRATDGYADDVVIAIKKATFKWQSTAKPDTEKVSAPNTSQPREEELQPITKPVLRDVDFSIRKGDFVVVHGSVGSGKSSLCAALLGELPSGNGTVFMRSSSVAYYSQQPWIQNMTIRDNILFGLPYDKPKYDKVLDACGLVKDIAMFPAGDRTEIGQKGVNLSGGQKARISLARACYADADMYILDTPLAAVDAVVQSEIFNKCLCGLLEKKTVILVTHLHDIIESDAANVKILVENNRVEATYTPTDRKKARRSYANLHKDAEDAERSAHRDDIDDNERKMRAASASGTLVDEEEREDGRVSTQVFAAYINALGGVKMLVAFILVLVGWQSFTAGSDIWLSHWTGAKPGTETTATTEENMTVYALLAVGAGVFVFARALLTAYTGVKASRFLFDAMTHSLVYAPLRFFDANPIGRILNRYAEDISTIDFRLPFNFYGMLVASSVNIFRLLTAIYVIKWVGLLLLPLGYVYVRVGVYYLASSREVSRLMKISTSPILSHLAASEEGVSVLRAFGDTYVERAIAENFARCDASNRVWYAQTVVNQWFTVRVQMIGFCVVVLVISTLLTLHEYLSPGLVGLAFMYAVSIDMGLSWWVKAWSWMEMGMVSPERIVDYVDIAPEGHATDRAAYGNEWPTRGTITFDSVKFAYKPGGDLVLKGLSFEVHHNEKIGIVGRTGAGKSSLTMALFRINELQGGRILLDGVDISTIQLQSLRSKISIIPQVPVLFKGPLRAYMDPFDEYSDVEIWTVFEKVGMKDMVSGLEGKLLYELSENGENFSVGERQLLCLARALLRKSRFVVMDEATASIDRATEKKLQEMIQREFVDATVITIAHRLSTVLESDRILVLSDGRVVEFDTPTQLARVKGGIFRELAKEGGYLAELEK